MQVHNLVKYETFFLKGIPDINMNFEECMFNWIMFYKKIFAI